MQRLSSFSARTGCFEVPSQGTEVECVFPSTPSLPIFLISLGVYA